MIWFQLNFLKISMCMLSSLVVIHTIMQYSSAMSFYTLLSFTTKNTEHQNYERFYYATNIKMYIIMYIYVEVNFYHVQSNLVL